MLTLILRYSVTSLLTDYLFILKKTGIDFPVFKFSLGTTMSELLLKVQSLEPKHYIEMFFAIY